MNNNKCLFCGEIIPEGRQICPTCEKREKVQNLVCKSILNTQEATTKAFKELAVGLIEKAKKTLTTAYDAYRRNADANDEAGAEDMARYWDGQADATQKSIDLIDELLQEFKGEKENG